MHLVANLSDLLLSLWHATIKYDTKKINTQYKIWKHQLHTFALAPTLLFNILPCKFWQNHCKLVRGVQLLSQHSITILELQQVHGLLCSWEREFETLYYQCREDHLHFIRPCIHQHTIGNLGQEIQQPNNPYENLSQEDLGDHYFLLCKRQKRPAKPVGQEAWAIATFLDPMPPHPVWKWTCVQLPNGQIVRCVWRESIIASHKLHVSHNIKVHDSFTLVLIKMKFHYFTRLAVPALQNGPDHWEWVDLLFQSSQVVASCKLLEEIVVVNIKHILSVITMVPHIPTLPSGIAKEHFFVVEKPGLDLADLGVPYPSYKEYEIDDNDATDELE
ncbi:hypothetical protein HD554DRAFT_2206089 [Boletus coccyginus]|nr:hypothetical protein HD554DRAFT_2206089 [Boletus coccyginus]